MHYYYVANVSPAKRIIQQVPELRATEIPSCTYNHMRYPRYIYVCVCYTAYTFVLSMATDNNKKKEIHTVTILLLSYSGILCNSPYRIRKKPVILPESELICG